MILQASAIALPTGLAARSPPNRAFLLAATCAALAVAALATSEARPDEIEPDLVQVLRGMAAIKAGFAGLALVCCFWRLSRPAASWRIVAYVLGPPLMAAGALALWRLEGVGLAAIGLHVGLFAVLAAAGTDADFIMLRRGRERGVGA